jgi:NAD+ synthase
MEDFTLINNFINTFIKKNVLDGNLKGAVIGISGGIDSAVVACCASIALGNDNVLGLILPDKEITPIEDIDDAIKICSSLKIEYKIIYVNNIKNELLGILEETDNKLVKGNLMSRVRMCILYYYANLLNRLVLGTTNKTEISIGYFTKYGDGASDLSPIGDLYKTQVREFAKFLKIPNHLIHKKSSARLWLDQQTENEIGLSFNDLDPILMFINKHNKKDVIIDSSLLRKSFPHISKEKIDYLLDLIIKNQHKFSMPAICNLE